LSAQCAPVKYSDSKPPRMMVCFKPAMVLVHAVTNFRYFLLQRKIRLGSRLRREEQIKSDRYPATLS
jgi:hypothetical protein